jgi:ferredoxin
MARTVEDVTDSATNPCKCKLVGGEVTMKTRDALTDAEITDGYILICQSMPKSDLIEIKID